MAEYVYMQKSTLQGIVDKVREKTGKTEPMSALDIEVELDNIKGGGSDLVKYVTFMNYDGTVELYKKPTIVGDDCVDVIAEGLLETPTRAATESHAYTFNGWVESVGGTIDSLDDIVEDRTVYASFQETPKMFTANFYDGETLMSSVQVAYGSKATPPSTSKSGYKFVGWTPSDLTITENTDFYGEWVEDLSAIPLTTKSGSYNSTYRSYKITIRHNTPLVVGETYRISFDGVEYVMGCRTVNYKINSTTMTDDATLGNPYQKPYVSSGVKGDYSPITDTGEPFYIVDGSTNATIWTKQEGEHTISVELVK